MPRTFFVLLSLALPLFLEASPRIQVTREGRILPNSGNLYAWSGQWKTSDPQPASSTTTFRVSNIGTSDLVISNFTVPPGFQIVEGLSSTIPSGGFDDYTIQITGQRGYFIGTSKIFSNDPNNSTFQLLIAWFVFDAPQFVIERDNVAIANGSTIDLGNLIQNDQAGVNLLFRNVATGTFQPVYTGRFQYSGQVTGPFGNLYISTNTWNLSFLMNTTELGPVSGSVTIPNNDPNNNPFIIHFSGNVVPQSPEITVLDNDQSILSGSTIPRNVGSVVQGQADLLKTFRIRNDGGLPLVISSVEASSPFTVTEEVSTVVAPGSHYDFTLSLLSITPGVYEGTISIQNNDSDEGNFTFQIRAKVLIDGFAELYVKVDDQEFTHGSTEEFYFGRAELNAAPLSKSVYIANLGTEDLVLQNFELNSPYQLSTSNDRTLGAGGDLTLNVTMATNQSGTFGGKLSFYSNDLDETKTLVRFLGASCTLGADPTVGLAYAYRANPAAQTATSLNIEPLPPYEVCLTDLVPNTDLVSGKYTHPVSPFSTPSASVGHLIRADRDFRVPLTGGNGVTPRQAVPWAGIPDAYFWIHRWRTEQFNQSFIESLNLPQEREDDVLVRQYRLGFDTKIPTVVPFETVAARGYLIQSPGNDLRFDAVAYDPLNTANPPSTTPRINLAWDHEALVGDYASLMQVLIMASPLGLPNEFGYDLNRSKENIYPAFGEGLTYWTAHRLTGNSSVYKYFTYAFRRTNGDKVCGNNVQANCDLGVNLDNPMMYNENATGSGGGHFPFTTASLNSPIGGDDLAGVFFGALFYSLAYEYGMGAENVDKLVWKTLSLISETGGTTVVETRLNMRQLATKFQQAARELFPRGSTGLSIYENHILQAFTARGIPLNGVANFTEYLPPAIGNPYTNGSDPGTMERNVAGANFGTPIPETHPLASAYNTRIFFGNGYNPILPPNTQYMAYKFVRESRQGPCDNIFFTHGPVDFANGILNSHPTNIVLRNRQMSDTVIFAQPRLIRFLRERIRCPNEIQGPYFEDVGAFGWRIEEAVADGFSFTTRDLGRNPATGKRKIEFNIFDPSATALGGSYEWELKEEASLQITGPLSGASVVLELDHQDLHELKLTRTRNGNSKTLKFKGNWEHFVRDQGNQFVRILPETFPGGVSLAKSLSDGLAPIELSVKDAQSVKLSGDSLLKEKQQRARSLHIRAPFTRDHRKCGSRIVESYLPTAKGAHKTQRFLEMGDNCERN